MVGRPSPKKGDGERKLIVKLLIRPNIEVGDSCEVRHSGISETMTAMLVQHAGSNWENDFYTSLELTTGEVSGGSVSAERIEELINIANTGASSP